MHFVTAKDKRWGIQKAQVQSGGTTVDSAEDFWKINSYYMKNKTARALYRRGQAKESFTIKVVEKID